MRSALSRQTPPGKIILHGFNPERILLAAEAVGLGRVAIERAARYAREREGTFRRGGDAPPYVR